MKILNTLGIASALLFANVASADDFTLTGTTLGQANAGGDVVLDQDSKQIIKTLQRKTFLKLKRWEL